MHLKRILAFVLIMAAAIMLLYGCGHTAENEGTSLEKSEIAENVVFTPAEHKTAAEEKENSDNQDNDDYYEAEMLLSKMTLEEKIGQMFFVRYGDSSAADAEKFGIGGFLYFQKNINGLTAEQIMTNSNNIQNASKIPVFIGADEEGGTVVRISSNPNLRDEPFGSAQSIYGAGGFEALESDAREKSELLLSLGINVNFAPVCDISLDPSDFIYNRTLGTDAETTGEYVERVVKVMNECGEGSVLKHFPGYGNNADTHTGSSYDSRTLESFYASDFIPFERGAEAGAGFVMVSHNVMSCVDPSVPASLSPNVISLIRDLLGDSICIITDDLGMEAVKEYTDNNSPEVLAVKAGNDMLCTSDYENGIPAIADAVKNGEISEEQIDRSVLRILSLKIRLGIINTEE